MANGIGRVGWRNFVSTAPTTASIVTTGLVLNLDASNPLSYSGTGTTWTDLSGNGNNGTLVNGTSYSSVNGGVISFDGINDYVTIPGNTPTLSLTQYSFDLWIQTTYSGNKVIMEKGENLKMIIQPDIDNTTMWYGDGSNRISLSEIIFNGNWRNIFVIQSLTEHRLYLDGILKQTTALGNLDANTYNISLMSRNGSYAQAGKISSLKIYNRVLTSAEVLQNFNSTKERFGFTNYTTRTTAFATATGITDTTILNALNTFDTGLISNGLDTKMKALYPFVGGTANTHKYNFMDPRDLDAAFRLVFSGGYIHSSTGALPNGTNGYANTFIRPSLVTSNINSVGASVYIRTNISKDYGYEFGCYGNPLGNYQFQFLNRFSGDLGQIRVANAGFSGTNGAITNSTGFFTTNRNSSTIQELYRNGNNLISGNVNSEGLPSYPIYLSANDGLGYITEYFSPREMSFFAYHDGLTTAQITTLNTLTQAFQTSLSRAV